jgi:hypothetical protein
MNRFLRHIGAVLGGWKAFWAAPVPEFRCPKNISDGLADR